MRWTGQEDQILADMRADKRPTTEIATRLGRTKGAVLDRAKRLSLPRMVEINDWTDEMAAELSRAMGIGRLGKQDRGSHRRHKERRTPPEPVFDDTSQNPTILTIGMDQCHFPLWGHHERPTINSPFCGLPVKPGVSYCPAHAAKIFVRPEPRTRRPADYRPSLSEAAQ